MNATNRPSWYLSGVKPVQNHVWTDEEKLAVYSLRTEDELPVESVANIFGVTKIQVYNTTRLVRRSKSKQCFSCGEKLTLKEQRQKKLIKSCDACKEKKRVYKQKRRKALLKKGICPVCEKKPLVRGRKACKGCISATQRRRYNEGLCGSCGKVPIATNRSTALCVTCLNTNKKIAANSRGK